MKYQNVHRIRGPDVFKDLSFSSTSLLGIAKVLRKKLPNGKNWNRETISQRDAELPLNWMNSENWTVIYLSGIF